MKYEIVRLYGYDKSQDLYTKEEVISSPNYVNDICGAFGFGVAIGEIYGSSNISSADHITGIVGAEVMIRKGRGVKTEYYFLRRAK